MIKSTILIKGATRERLKHRGIKGETYDNLINRLLDKEELNSLNYLKMNSNPKEAE